MKAFKMIRNKDESGISGTGVVLNGIIFDDGVTVARWAVKGKANSTTVYDSFEDFKDIHVTSHPTNETEFEFLEVPKDGERVKASDGMDAIDAAYKM